MTSITRLDLNIDEIRAKFGIVDNRQVTFPEMICHKLLETNISKWIAFLLNSKQNKYALQILNVFLKQLDIPECSSEEMEVYNECILDIDSRIDVYIITPEYIIGIEVKLTATETGGDQTERYHEIITKRCQRDNKKPVEIYLKPSSNTNIPKCDAFKIITFKDILSALHELSKKLPIDRDHFILDEFINFIEVDPERARFLSTLPKEQITELNTYHYGLKGFDGLYKYMANYLEAHSKYILMKKNPDCYSDVGLGFMQLQRKERADWKKTINFHYEILWTESHYLALNKKVIVAVHLEPPTRLGKEKRKEIIKFFHADMYDGKTLFSREIDVDFTSEDKTQETLDRIIEIFDSEVVSKWGDIADKCIEKFAQEI